MLNKVQIIGNCGADPEIRTTQSGEKIANLRVAVTEKWTDRASGERKERTEWFRVACFNDTLTDVIEKYVHKGSKLYLEGQLQTRKWTDQQGQERYSTEVVLSKFRGQMALLDSRNSSDQPREETQRAPAPGNMRAQPRDELDEEIPF